MRDDAERLHEELRELAYLIALHTGLLRLVRRLGLQPKAWILEREARDVEEIGGNE